MANSTDLNLEVVKNSYEKWHASKFFGISQVLERISTTLFSMGRIEPNLHKKSNHSIKHPSSNKVSRSPSVAKVSHNRGDYCTCRKVHVNPSPSKTTNPNQPVGDASSNPVPNKLARINTKPNGQPSLVKKRLGKQIAGKPKVSAMMDARQKIIQKKRKNVMDARDILAKMAKKQDARSKILRIREQRKGENVVNGNVRAIGTSILQKTDRNGKISLVTNKAKQSHPHDLNMAVRKHIGMVSSTRTLPNIRVDPNFRMDSHRMDPNRVGLNRMDVNRMDPSRIDPKRIGSNRMGSIRGGPIRGGSFSSMREDPMRPTSSMRLDSMRAGPTIKKIITKRPLTAPSKESIRNFQPPVIRKTILNDVEYSPGPTHHHPSYMYESSDSYRWHRPDIPSQHLIVSTVDNRRQLQADSGAGSEWRSSFPSAQSSRMQVSLRPTSYIDLDAADDEDMPLVSPLKTTRISNIHSRLDNNPVQPQSHGILAQTKTKVVVPVGHRIVISNLQSTVTQDDIRELFEDIGQLLIARLVRPGTAEVIYKNLKDAQKAVDTYHNRQLDGQPMKCLLVNKRPLNNPTAPAITTSPAPTKSTNEGFLGARKSSSNNNANKLVPDLSTIHKVLFQRNN